MTLHDVIATDAAIFTSTADFGEVVTYYAKPTFGETAAAGRAIDAVVLRETVQVIGSDGDTLAPVWQVHVANDSTLGISSQEIDVGRDQIALPPRDGKSAERRTITQILIQDHGMLVLECR